MDLHKLKSTLYLLKALPDEYNMEGNKKRIIITDIFLIILINFF